MENFARDLLSTTIPGGADSGNEYPFPNPRNPFVQAGASSTDLGEIPFPNPFDQAGGIDGGVDQMKESFRLFPLCQILKATNDFDDALVIGSGGYGKVYKASIDDGATTTVVAIKRLSAASKQGAEEFWTEVKLLSKLRHTNLVSLIGYCNENQEMILVYKYVAGGVLADHLYKTSSCGRRSHLTWEQRLKICLGAARGLDYIHNGSLQGVIHRDVKSTNILLDEYLVAKVSDFGLSKSITTDTTTHVSTMVKGTFGYLDPDYYLAGRLTKKSDVYGFGVVLLEVLCGRPAVDPKLDEQQIVLVRWARMNIKEGTLDRIIDPSLIGDTTSHGFKYFAELANKCLHKQPKERPTMAQVVESLEIALVSHKRKSRSQGTIAKPWRLRPGGGEIVEHITLSSSEFDSANNKAQCVGQNESGSAASDCKKKRTREQEDREEINTSITLDDLRQHYGRKRKDVAESLGVSVSTLKRNCRRYGIKRWPNIIRKKAGRPLDQHGEKNQSPTSKMPSTNGQTEIENEIVGHLEQTNEFLQDFVEGPNEAGVSSEWAFQLRNQWTVSTTHPNSNGPEVPHPHRASTQILGDNIASLGDGRNSFDSREEHLLQGHISGSMWTVPPCLDPASSQHMSTISPTMGSSEDLINSLAFLEDVFLEEDFSGSISWTIPSCSEPAPNQLMPTVPRTMGCSDDFRNLLPSVEESFSAGHVSGFINRTVPSCSYRASSQPMSTVPHITGSSDDLGNLLASVGEPFGAGYVSESINSTVPLYSDPAPSQSMLTIPHTISTIPQMIPLLTERQDMGSVRLKATYGNTTIKFHFPFLSGFSELKEEVSKRLEFEFGIFKLEYKDEEGDSVLIACDEDVRDYLRLLTSLGNQVIKLFVLDKVPFAHATHFCDNCRLLKCKRP